MQCLESLRPTSASVMQRSGFTTHISESCVWIEIPAVTRPYKSGLKQCGRRNFVMWPAHAAQNCEKRLLPPSCLSCLSVRPIAWKKKLGSHWTYFHEIWYLNIFRKSVDKTQVSLKSDKNNGYFTWGLMYVNDNTVLISS